MIEQLLAFVLASAVVIVVPGPDMMLVIRNAARSGRTGAAWTAVGIMTGNAILATLAAVGITALLLASSALYGVVRIAGGLYLVWLGVQAVRAYIRMRKLPSGLVPVVAADSGGVIPGTRRRSFRQGFLCNILNPKVAAFYLALFPQFDLAPLSPAVEHALLAALFWIMGLLWYVVTISLLDRIQGVLRSPSFARRTEATAGAALLGMGAWVLAYTD